MSFFILFSGGFKTSISRGHLPPLDKFAGLDCNLGPSDCSLQSDRTFEILPLIAPDLLEFSNSTAAMCAGTDAGFFEQYFLATQPNPTQPALFKKSTLAFSSLRLPAPACLKNESAEMT